MISLTLKCYKSFQNENNRKVTHSFAPRRLIWPFLNLGIGTGIGIGTGFGTDITNIIISTSIKPMDPKISRVVTQNEGAPLTKSRDILITWSCDNSMTLYLHFRKAYGSQTQQDTSYSVVVTIEVCAEGNSQIQVLAYFYPSLSNKSIIYLMSKKPSGCNGNLALAKNKHKNVNQN